jgi:hypothetical protein
MKRFEKGFAEAKACLWGVVVETQATHAVAPMRHCSSPAVAAETYSSDIVGDSSAVADFVGSSGVAATAAAADDDFQLVSPLGDSEVEEMDQELPLLCLVADSAGPSVAGN